MQCCLFDLNWLTAAVYVPAKAVSSAKVVSVHSVLRRHTARCTMMEPEDKDNDKGASGDGGKDMAVDGDVRQTHAQICGHLNIDREAEATSWQTYTSVSHKYTLDGNPMQWLACSLYIACRKSLTMTVGEANSAIEGNCVNLTKLLRICEVTLRQFFILIKKWIDMASLPEDFRKKVTDLERHFSVSTVLFGKLRPIFNDLFVGLDSCEPPRPSKSNKKAKMTPCNANLLFEFTWCLFICIKGEFPALSSDLVNMYHLLLACADFIFANVFTAKRKDLINPNFKGLPPNWSNPNFEIPSEAPCIISILCKNYEGLELEAKTTKFYCWRNCIDKFFENGYIHGDSKKLNGLLDIANFDFNLKSLNKLYETYILSVGEFDERIFLNEPAPVNRGANNDELSKVLSSASSSSLSSLVHGTPLTGRNYLKHKNDILTPVSTATQSVAKLHAFLAGCSNTPSATFMALYKDSPDNLIEGLISRQKTMAVQFLLAYSTVSTEDLAGNHLNLAEALYYRLLEMILKEEVRKKGNINLEKLISEEHFNKTLFACCVEIVIYAYGVGNVRFPWVLHCFRMDAFYFYKIIEIVAQEIKEPLSRDVIKHLNTIEESVLEAHAWTSNGVIWERLESLDRIPPWSEVCIKESPHPSSSSTYLTTMRRFETLSNTCMSPVSSTDRFINPSTPGAEIAKKQLFKDVTIKPGQSLLNQNVGGVLNINVTPSTSGEILMILNENPTPKKTVKGGSLGLFLRKFYQLASVRMVDLYQRLDLTDQVGLKEKIWTCFEHAIIHQTHLMKDRHLDQILMCSVYVVCRVNKVEQTFADIMRCYRFQPQSTASVYRNVLIKYTTPGENATDGEGNQPSENGVIRAPVPQSPPSPGQMAGQSISHQRQERGDLIKFYNEVYVPCMQSFVNNAELELSVLPRQPTNGHDGNIRATRRVSDRFNVHPLTEPSPSPPASSQLTYCFSRSPAKDLQDINRYISKENIAVKRSSDMQSNIPEKKGCSLITKKLHGLFSERSSVAPKVDM